MIRGTRGWFFDILGGGITGAVLGLIIAVNFVIFIGVDEGYEATISEMFRHNTLAGVVEVAILVAGPVGGVLVARRLRRQRADTPTEQGPLAR